jgi:hypothetical protein
MDRSRQFLCKCHPDFHIPADAVVGEGFDGDAYARRLKECSVEAVAFFAKCHYGHSYYPTKVGYVHPRLRKDMLGEVARGCRKHGIGVVAYYSTFYDRHAAELHPDWAQRDREGKTSGGPFIAVCANSPYVKELMLPQCIEVVTQYGIDELLLDTMSWSRPCYCEHCRRLFGRDIPLSAQDPHWLQYVRWYKGRFDEFFSGIPAAIHEAAPRVAVCHNWMYSLRLPETAPPSVDRLIGDSQASSVTASTHCRYWAGTGLPFDYMVGRFLHGLGDWNSAPADRLKAIAATSVANGGGFYIIDRQFPDGSLDEPAYEALRETFGFVRERAAAVQGTCHVPEIAVLNALSTVNGADGRRFSLYEERLAKAAGFAGAAQLLVEHGRHFTGLNEEMLGKRMGDYRVVILPEQEGLPAELLGKLEAYVRNGGRLLITQSDCDEAVDERLLDLAGVRFRGFTSLQYGYVGAQTPIVVRGRFAKSERASAAEVYPYVVPMGAEERGRTFGHGCAPPAGRGDFPAVASRKLGKGEVVYVAAPAFRSYRDYPSHLVADLMLGLVGRLLPDPIARLTAPPHVELVLTRRDNDLFVHLVNHSGKDLLSKEGVPVMFHAPEIRGIRLEIRTGPAGARVCATPSGKELPCTTRGEYTELAVPRLGIMESVCMAGYFARRAD